MTFLDMLARAKWFSFLDLNSGYWQVALHSSNKEKTAFLLDMGCGSSQLWPSKECEVAGTYTAGRVNMNPKKLKDVWK
jgi:hypothetical protein